LEIVAGDLLEAAARASTLYERSPANGAGSGENDSERILSRLRHWKENCAKGDDAEFDRRLREDGFERDRLSALVGEGCLPSGAPLPDWTVFLRDAFASASGWEEKDLFVGLAEHREFPFYPLVRPFTEHAFALLERSQKSRVRMDAHALDEAREQLAHVLCRHAALALNLEFTIFKSSRESRLESFLRRARGEESDGLFRDFVLSFYRGRWVPFLKEYAVLARQLATVARNWAGAVAELLDRLYVDRELLAIHLNGGEDPGELSRAVFGVSDRHNGGRSTTILHFNSGFRLVYKPKPLDTDLVMGDLVQWINRTESLLPLRAVPVVGRAGYGWQQYVDHVPCADDEAIRRFYLRSGYQLALIYALEGYDCHHENIIASGEFPYLIDTETIFNPYKESDAAASPQENAAKLASQAMLYSVVRTGMLPGWNVQRDGRKKDTSGFGGGSVAANSAQALGAWVGGNSDDVRLETRLVPVEQMRNQPYLEHSGPQTADSYTEEIRAGFRQMSRFLIERREELTEILRRRPRTQVRFVRRATNLYVQQMWSLSNPAFLRNGIDWSIELERLARMFLVANSPNKEIWNLLREESAAMIQLDVPYFKVRSDQLNIYNAEGRLVVHDYFSRTCLERLVHKVETLHEGDIVLQERYIAYAFYARAAKPYHEQPEASATLTQLEKASTADHEPASRDACVAVAEEIARGLADEAVRSPDGTAAWIALEYLKEADVFQLKPVSFNFYSGGIGIAYFLVALAKITSKQKYADLALAAARPMMRLVDEELEALVRHSTVGGGVGIGSLIYGLASIAHVLEGSAFGGLALGCAQKCAARVDEALLQNDEKLDVVFGTAGLILALAKLYRVAPEESIVDCLRLAAHRLLQSGIRNAAGENLVATYEGQVITGFSHGAAGVALALMRAGVITGDAAFREAAMDHVAYEESRFDEAAANYPDYRSQKGRPAFMTAWCHGAPGIGLSRLAMYQLTRDSAFLPQIEKNIRTTASFTLDHLDHICCGNLGRIDIQLEYALHFDDAPMLESLRKDAACVLERYRQSGAFRLFLNTPNKVFSPGFFVGATGIAYNLLRLANPRALPSVLAFN
jgi:type 2 lantibiotic biosynthesis protein LanM